MKYLDKKFSSPPNSKAYVDGWDAVFGEKECATVVRYLDGERKCERPSGHLGAHGPVSPSP
jgi:hypothetical protein